MISSGRRNWRDCSAKLALATTRQFIHGEREVETVFYRGQIHSYAVPFPPRFRRTMLSFTAGDSMSVLECFRHPSMTLL